MLYTWHTRTWFPSIPTIDLLAPFPPLYRSLTNRGGLLEDGETKFGFKASPEYCFLLIGPCCAVYREVKVSYSKEWYLSGPEYTSLLISTSHSKRLLYSRAVWKTLNFASDPYGGKTTKWRLKKDDYEYSFFSFELGSERSQLTNISNLQ